MCLFVALCFPFLGWFLGPLALQAHVCARVEVVFAAPCSCARVCFCNNPTNNGEQTIIKSHRGLFDSVNRTHSRVWGVFFVWSVLFSAWGVLCNGGGESVGAHA